MMNSSDSSSILDDDTMGNNSDTGWTIKSNKIHLSDSSEPKSPDPIKTIPNTNTNYNKLFITVYRYEVFSQTEPVTRTTPDLVSTSTTPEISTINHIKPPPPIFVKGVIDFSKTCEALIELIGVDNFYCKSSDRLKIQTANPQSYRSLIHFLKE
ncbi:Hypothetical protein CINCED_3A011021 [Cinara cedri]|uniref:Uncharacterized protein n=1 Tax=Cinara cedri TaxID=506608 RepID=A0A5E4NGI5_9HEMI|nr:Hypothetical protein CINCED_3A011021 [Cinara cedri]